MTRFPRLILSTALLSGFALPVLAAGAVPPHAAAKPRAPRHATVRPVAATTTATPAPAPAPALAAAPATAPAGSLGTVQGSAGGSVVGSTGAATIPVKPGVAAVQPAKPPVTKAN